MAAAEATIVEQLQRFHRWQLEQEEELIRQQEEQRNKLTSEQSRVYKALSVSVNEMNLSEQSLQELIEGQQHDKGRMPTDLIDLDSPEDDNDCATPTGRSHQAFSQFLSLSAEKNNNSRNLKVPKGQLAVRNATTNFKQRMDYNDSYNQHDYSSENSLDGTQSFTESRQRHSISIDEIPVPSPKQDFNALLEERLKDSEAVKVEGRSKPVVKRPFLKKGQGLARFMPGSNADNGSKSTRPRSASFNGKPSKTTYLERCNSMPRAKKADAKKYNPPPVVAQPKLTLKNVAPPRKNPHRGKSITPTPTEKKKQPVVCDSSGSDLEVKTKQELDEMRIFELLEDKAENSSFCSTSSTVIAFLQQSTPLKQKALLHSVAKRNNVVINDVGGRTLEEIVRTTASNQPVALRDGKESSGTRERKCGEQQWDEVPVARAKKDSTAVGAVLPYGTDVDENYDDDYTGNQELSQDENNVSLHVRFSEYNEYKTMTDTSSVSSDSQTTINYVNEKGAWSDCSDSSDMESISSQLKANGKYDEAGVKPLDYLKNKHEEYSEQDETDDEKNKEAEEHEEHEEDEDEEEHEDETESNNVTLQEDETVIDARDDSASFFKKELLKTRLLQLQKEIDVFRKESAALLFQKQKLQEERTKLQEERIMLQRSFKEKEEALDAEKRKHEAALAEEKKRLAREKAALENRMRDAWEKAQKSKHERQEIQLLRDQLDELKDELAQKESKWTATHARQRSQMRVVQTENARLKQELEKQQKRNAKPKRVTGNARAIHQISKFLADRKKISPFKPDDLYEQEEEQAAAAAARVPDNAEPSYHHVEQEVVEEEPPAPEEKQEKPAKSVKTMESIARTRNLYESLLKDATDGLSEGQIERRNLMYQHAEVPRQEGNLNAENSGASPGSPGVAGGGGGTEDTERNDGGNEGSNQKERHGKQDIREVHHPDGRVEYWYPNGNVKKLFPDKCLTKMIYYNGDVREIDKNGTVKYFYAATRTWHTTMPDGLEILEFPDGQVERRSKDGTVEVSFPDGSVRIDQPDGSQKWELKDGTIAETSADGDKFVTLPNGQREIHTKNHKRREYPDGTVKLVYPDGAQETRYANGRIRVKDKDGNLIMDTHQ